MIINSIDIDKILSFPTFSVLKVKCSENSFEIFSCMFASHVYCDFYRLGKNCITAKVHIVSVKAQ